ncbi:pyridoxamine 5'-phosphate oxidase family protein [Microbacterium sp. P01]|uniref:pyridoxamine 5'-phosphate oxidase family protein n=1 Tax=unclassified Microbacterium TaxID=2609290 RepID=UPI00366CCCF7
MATTTALDPANPEHEKALRMLEHDLIAWITTIGKDGTPRAVPVWFLWQDGRVFIMSEPTAGKVAHIRRGSPVLVHLQAGGEFGDDVVILHGSAEISPQPTAEWFATHGDTYGQKYAAAIEDYGTPADQLPGVFSSLIVFTPARVQTW